MAQDPKRSVTPEKQLLNLIEDPKSSGLADRTIRQKTFSFFSLAALRGRFSFFGEKLRSISSPRRMSFDLKEVNGVLSASTVVLILILAWRIALSVEKVKKVPDFGLGESRELSEGINGAGNAKKLAEYLDRVRARDLFRFGGMTKISIDPEEVPQRVAEPEEPMNLAEEMVGSLRLVGIGWSDDPDVMIEDTNTKKVYFLKRGNWIDGRIQINAVFEDRVILSFDGGEAELK